MGKDNRFKRAQSTTDYLILTAVILAVIIPLLFISTSNLRSVGVSQLTEALESIENGIVTVNSLGYGAAKRVIIWVPKGVTRSQVGAGKDSTKNELYFIVVGQIVYTKVPAAVAGNLPINEGLHHINLFNNGTHVLIYECGNGIVEAWEQCDFKDPSKTGKGSNVVKKPGYPPRCCDVCYPPGHDKECLCWCENDKNCPPGSICTPVDPYDPKKGKYCESVPYKTIKNCAAPGPYNRLVYACLDDCAINKGSEWYCDTAKCKCERKKKVNCPDPNFNSATQICNDVNKCPIGEICDLNSCLCVPSKSKGPKKIMESCDDPTHYVGTYMFDPTKAICVDNCPRFWTCDAKGTCKCSVQLGICGNKILETGEDCEEDFYCKSTERCGLDCKCYTGIGKCGNGILDSKFEECDPPGKRNAAGTMVCNKACRWQRPGTICGDGWIDIPFEQCDPKSKAVNNGCPITHPICTPWCTCWKARGTPIVGPFKISVSCASAMPGFDPNSYFCADDCKSVMGTGWTCDANVCMCKSPGGKIPVDCSKGVPNFDPNKMTCNDNCKSGEVCTSACQCVPFTLTCKRPGGGYTCTSNADCEALGMKCDLTTNCCESYVKKTGTVGFVGNLVNVINTGVAKVGQFFSKVGTNVMNIF